MLHAEYQRFLQSLNEDDASEGVRKIANLVAVKIDELAPLGTQQGQRIRRIVSLTQENWDTLSPVIAPLAEKHGIIESRIQRLERLRVGPFRGFARPEEFDLSSKLVLVYGPNGTGKSSFCEALEFGLLGTVAEAENKRFRNQQDYLKNAHTNSYAAPELWGATEEQGQCLISSDEAVYRFCFVEKNRIDDFSRIAAQAPARQTELISTLFGLDSFDEFVRNFSQEIDGKYIDLTGKSSVLLNQKRQMLTGFEQKLKDGYDELTQVDRDQVSLARQYCEGKTFAQMDAELHGEEDNPGSIAELEKQLEGNTKSKSNLESSQLTENIDLLIDKLAELHGKQKELADASQQVSFKTMFEALSQLEHLSLDYCPACHTPLDQVSVNPFSNATEELEKLKYLGSLQEAEKQLRQQTKELLKRLHQTLFTCCARISPNALDDFRLEYPESVDEEWWRRLNQAIDGGATAIEKLEAQVKQLEDGDVAIEQEIQKRSAKQARLAKLRDFSRQILVINTRQQSAQKSINAAQQALTSFETENAKLIAAAEAEIPTVERNVEIARSYRAFVSLLNRYKERLPEQLVADLGDRVKNLYNSFNRNDTPSEKLAEVQLPLSQNQRLEITFQDDPERRFDALHVLSEGHIRCIGLAILLAKNLKEECPILIFDDPVNAIDDDHRDSIRRTIFEDQHFAQKQVILTCHGEEFFKDISNMLPAQSVAQCKTMTFLPRIDEAHIRVDFHCSPRNYILAARAHYERNELRDALTKSRQALETLAKAKIWRYVNKHGDGNLSIKLRSATSPIELRNLSDQLKSKIAAPAFADENKERVLDPLAALLGQNGNSREWRYLNKGVHEEDNRGEFDRQTIEEIITHLESIDTALATN